LIKVNILYGSYSFLSAAIISFTLFGSAFTRNLEDLYPFTIAISFVHVILTVAMTLVLKRLPILYFILGVSSCIFYNAAFLDIFLLSMLISILYIPSLIASFIVCIIKRKQEGL
jgi:nicotinamide riboside transporter PnuC